MNIQQIISLALSPTARLQAIDAERVRRIEERAKRAGLPLDTLREIARTTLFSYEEVLRMREGLPELNQRQFITVVGSASGDPYYLRRLDALRQLGADLTTLPEEEDTDDGR